MAQTITVSPTVQPPLPDHMSKWVRGADPFHADAFVGTPGEGVVKSAEPRKGGWFGEDWFGNAIAFVADGTVIAGVNVVQTVDIQVKTVDSGAPDPNRCPFCGCSEITFVNGYALKAREEDVPPAREGNLDLDEWKCKDVDCGRSFWI